MSIESTIEKQDQRVALVCSHLIYEIATGVFASNDKLPTIREAVRRWQVDHRYVLKAYQRLEQLGLVRSVPRSGYFVAVGEPHELISRHRFALQRIFERVAEEISEGTNLSLLGAFRYLAQLAETQARREPECVFVECTQIQASGHADEVSERLAIPCMSMTTTQLSGSKGAIPSHVRTMLVTGFHLAELKKLKISKAITVHAVPIEVAPFALESDRKARNVIVFESDQVQAQHMIEDVKSFAPSGNCRMEVTGDIDESLASMFTTKKSRANTLAFLSPRLWGQVDDSWRNHDNVRLIRFQIVETAWPGIADAIGLPLGPIAGERF